MQTKSEKKRKLNFKDYYNSCSLECKLIIREAMVPKYMSYSNFYFKLTNNSWLEYDYEKLELLTGENFRP